MYKIYVLKNLMAPQLAYTTCPLYTKNSKKNKNRMNPTKKGPMQMKN
jgi:hypothetical protein